MMTRDHFLIGNTPVKLGTGDRVVWDTNARAFVILRGVQQMTFNWVMAASGAKLWVGGDESRANRVFRLLSALSGLPLLQAQGASSTLARIFGQKREVEYVLRAGFYLDGHEVRLQSGDRIEWHVELGTLSFRRGTGPICVSGCAEREEPHSLHLGDGCGSAIHLVNACTPGIREIARLHGTGVCYEIQDAV